MWAFELLQDGRFHEAAIFSKIVYGGSANFPEVKLAEELGKTGESVSRALEFLEFILIDRNISKKSVERFEIFQLMARLFISKNDIESSLEYLNKSLNSLPKNNYTGHARESVEYQQASLLAQNNQFAEAQEIFDKGLRVKCGNGWVTTTKIIDFRERKTIFDDNTTLEAELFFENTVSNTSAPKMVYFVAADIIYCTKFAIDLITAFSKIKHKDIHIHIHGITIDDWPKDQEKWTSFTETLREFIKDTEISLCLTHSISSKTFSMSDIQKKTIYSFERFRLLPQLLKHYELPVVVADIDQIPLLSPLYLVDFEFDFALLKLTSSRLNFLSLFSATLSVFKPTQEGLKSAYKLKSYFDRAYQENGLLKWHLDQAGLAVVALTNRHAKLLFLDEKIVTTDARLLQRKNSEQSEAYFFSVTNSLNIEA